MLRFVMMIVLAAVSVPFAIYMIASLTRIRRENPGAFNTRRLSALLPLWGPMLMYAGVLFLSVGIITLSAYQPVPPAPVTEPVSAGATLEMPRTKSFQRLIWASGESLDVNAVECIQVSSNPNFQGTKIQIDAPKGWPADVRLELDGESYQLLTSTGVFDHNTISCNGGGLEKYLATPNPNIGQSQVMAIAVMALAPLIFIVGLIIWLTTRKRKNAPTPPAGPTGQAPYPYSQQAPPAGPYHYPPNGSGSQYRQPPEGQYYG